MKLQLSALLAASTLAAAQPANWSKFLKNNHNTEVNSLATNATGFNSTATNSSGWGNWTVSNSTQDAHKDIFKVIITGGDFKLDNSSHLEYEYCYNQTNALNLTQLYEVAEIVNTTISDDRYKAVVIVSGGDSMESLGFLNSILIDSEKPVVISQSDAYGIAVANKTASKGTLVVTNDDYVYPGVFSPYSTRYSSFGGVPVAACGDDLSVNYFFESYETKFLSGNSTIRKNFTDFTNYNATKDLDTLPVVPIIAESELSATVLESLAASVDAIVVVATEDDRDTIKTVDDYSNVGVPVVFAKSINTYPFLSDAAVPTGTCSAGYLSPTKAQLLLSIALINGVTNVEDIVTLFP
ncbi:hypothetical protein TPHA_0O01530 [Tetrapisispora phaffii CBS 4417]|uniref:L-asparaginase N-terminal domain-containing protein n=1 Tax=Tetrapisispora phaffii (strain ATCC 24235 / CBS 4417 / NBRC 1672 / NRRL Y-8282 / UCD 70-5) TaxID=1071381 RepID=G8C1U2_TETPH|nr:hypothetical protein TPHA_0O01530 [Tetrapisispora phaffii CBS 4417]CCE66120.1 hypothetical protein TPHA_0O01530 [Tetrapisispora phaffii CBS 4417]